MSRRDASQARMVPSASPPAMIPFYRTSQNTLERLLLIRATVPSARQTMMAFYAIYKVASSHGFAHGRHCNVVFFARGWALRAALHMLAGRETCWHHRPKLVDLLTICATDSIAPSLFLHCVHFRWAHLAGVDSQCAPREAIEALWYP